jgi:hypothetical protein
MPASHNLLDASGPRSVDRDHRRAQLPWRIRESGRPLTRLSSSVNARPACGSFSNQDSLEICPLTGVDQKRPANVQNDANSPLRTSIGTGHSRPIGAVGVVSGLPQVATIGADIPVRQLRAKSGCRIPSPELGGEAALQTASPSCGKAMMDERCRQDPMNESRSGLRTSACVVSMPWGYPG